MQTQNFEYSEVFIKNNYLLTNLYLISSLHLNL